jgi:phosphoglycolate phosphatase-like HAD superfamily hydrolase
VSLLALLPVGVLVVGLVAVGALVARAADEANQLRAALRRLSQLRPLVVEVGDSSRRLQAALAHRRR